MSNGSWWVGGGIDSNYWKMNAVEYTDGGDFERGVHLPIFVYDHCAVKLDENRIFLAGGMRDTYTL